MKMIAEFKINYFQYLDDKSNVVSELPEWAKSREKLIGLLKWMMLTREIDQRAINLQRTGKLGTFPSSLGQEAVAVGLGQALAEEDIFVPYYRDQGTLIQRGIDPWQVYAYWGGDERGSDYRSHREDFPICVPIATQLLHAAGAAYAVKLRRQKRAVLTICGDGGTSEGDFYEALNFAGSFSLPIVFIVNNNQWAISVPRSQQSACQTLAQKAIAGGFEGIQVDGNDVIAVTEQVSLALKQAREHCKPMLIEALNYRLCDHTTADDARRYTPQGMLEEAWKFDPISRLKDYLKVNYQLSDDEITALKAECEAIVQKSVDFYNQLAPQPASAMFDYLYETLPAAFEKQYQEVINKKINTSH